MRFKTLLSAALLLSGCVTIAIDGFSLHEGLWREDEQAIRARGSFELACPAESLKLRVLAPWAGNDVYAGQVGVTGCDKRVVYVRTHGSGWVANTASAEPAPKAAP